MIKKSEIEQILKDYNLDLGDDYTYHCASIIKRSSFPDYTEILFCEDDFLDPNGIPYIMQANVGKDEFTKDRMIVFYTSDTRRFLVPMDDTNWKIIGTEIPSNVANIDYGKATKIYHRKTLEIKKEPIEITEDEKKQLVKKYIKLYKKGRMILGGILSTFLWFILTALPAVFLIADDNINSKGDNVIIIILAIWASLFIIGSVFIIRFFIKLPVKRLKGLSYKSEFLVVGWSKDINVKGLDESHISGYTYDDNMCKLLTYGISHYDISLIEGVEYFEVVYRYSKEKNPRNLDFCLFVRNNKM